MRVIFLLVLHIVTSSFLDICSLRYSLQHLSRQSLQSILSQTTILSSSYCGLNEQQLHRILTTPMPHLDKLILGQPHPDPSSPSSLNQIKNKPSLTYRLVKTIFNSHYIWNIRELDLGRTNLDDRAFQFLDGFYWQHRRQLRLEILKLGGNYLTKDSLNRLAQFRYPKLRQLDISSSLLNSPQPIQALAQIIGTQNGSVISSRIEVLDISSTNIEAAGFVQIMQSLDSLKLKHLNMSNNNLHQPNLLQNPADLTAYRHLSSLSLPSLIQLQMNDLSLDYSIIQLFKQWHLPQLQTLGVFLNFIDDQSVIQWITKANMPNLRRLILYNNFITDQAVQHLRDEKFTLQLINLGFNQIRLAGLLELTQMQHSIQTLYLKQIKVQSHDLRQFVQKMDWNSIRHLGFSGNAQASDLLSYLPWTSIPHLQTLVLSHCNLQGSISQIISSKQSLSPNLKTLLLNATSLNSSIIFQLIQTLPRVFPQLQFADLIQQHLQPINFSQLKSYSHLKANRQLLIDLGYVRWRQLTTPLQILSITYLGTLALYSVREDLSAFFQHPKQLNIKVQQQIDPTLKISSQILRSIARQLLQFISLSSLEQISLGRLHQLTLFKQLLITGQIIELSNLQAMSIIFSTQLTQVLWFFQHIKFPLLKQITLTVIITVNQTEELNQLMRHIQMQKCLTSLHIQFQFSNNSRSNYSFNKYFNQLSLPFLENLDLGDNQLNSKEISGLIQKHTWSLRQLNLNNNFLQTQFLQGLSVHSPVLTHLDLNFISLNSQQFSYLKYLQLAFLRSLSLQSCQLTTHHILQLLQNSNNTLFPKLSFLNLNDNDIREKGTLELFSKGLPQLSFFKIKRNFNPNFLNILLSYNSKLLQISAIGAEVYSLSPQISPVSTRRARMLAITTNDFSQSDFQILGALDYRKLLFSQLIAKDVSHCQFFKHLLPIARHVSKFVLFLQNQVRGLTSQCLAEDRAFDDYSSQIQQLIVSDKHDNIYAPEFISLLLHSQRNLKTLMLYRTKMPPQVFLSISHHRIKHIQIINIPRNYLGDQGFTWLLSTPLASLKFLDASENEISVQSFGKLQRRVLRQVEEINLSGNPLGNDGLAILSSMQMPQLKRLFLMSCGIDNLNFLKKWKFPNLHTLGLQRNLLSSQQLLNLLQEGLQGLPLLKNISFKGIRVSALMFSRLKEASKKRGLMIQLDHPFYIEMKNGAHY